MAARRPHTQSTPVHTSAPATQGAIADVPTFAALGLPAVLATELERRGITSPFPIQVATLPDALSGRDVLGRGRTGSGKTYGFVLPLLARLAAKPQRRQSKRPRALILAPTRELASQIDAAMAPLAKALGLTTLTVFGGVGANPQINGLRAGVDVVVACPGRLEDHVRQGHADLTAIEITVLDEADHMADLGFLPVVRRLLDKTPERGQRMLFSATLDSGVDVLVKRYLHNPVTHSVDSASSPVSTMSHHVLHINAASRIGVLADLTSAPGRTLVFTRTKHGAKQLARKLTAAGVPAVDLHGNLSQGARTRNLEAFSDGRAKTLVATDIAARGIHVDDVALVIHADPPVEHKAYLHRSGRTARAGASGTVVTFMTDAQVSDVRDLTRKAGIKPTITRISVGHPLLEEISPGERVLVEPSAEVLEHANRSRGGGGGGQGRGGRGGQGGGGRRSSSRRAASAPTSSSGGRSRSGGRRSGAQATTGASTPSRSAASFSASARPSARRGSR